MEAYERLVNEGNQVLVITISSKLSATYNSAVQASLDFEGKVYVVDSMNACIGERLLCQYALKLIEEGMVIEDIVNELNEKKKKINVMALVDTLEYLKRGGRISKVTAIAGEILSIKPVLAVIDGEVKMLGKARGSKRANNLLSQMVEEKGGINFSMPYGTIYAGLSDARLKKYIEDSSYLWKRETDNIPIYIIGSTIGTHVGPGAIGVAFFEK